MRDFLVGQASSSQDLEQSQVVVTEVNCGGGGGDIEAVEVTKGFHDAVSFCREDVLCHA